MAAEVLQEIVNKGIPKEIEQQYQVIEQKYQDIEQLYQVDEQQYQVIEQEYQDCLPTESVSLVGLNSNIMLFN